MRFSEWLDSPSFLFTSHKLSKPRHARRAARATRKTRNWGAGLESLEHRLCLSSGTPIPVYSDGSLDTSFNATGMVATSISSGSDVANSVASQTDGKIVVAGTSNGKQLLVARYNADGSLDTSFNGTGEATLSFGASSSQGLGVAVEADGTIVVAGSAKFGAGNKFAVACFNSDGTLDTGFGGGNGWVTTAFSSGDAGGHSVALQKDGKIVVAGNGSYNDGSFAIARYNTDGTLDTGFGGGTGKLTGIFFNTGAGTARSVAIQADGKIVIAGPDNYGGGGIHHDFGVARFNPDGSFDTSFGNGTGEVTTDLGNHEYSGSNATSVAIQADGKIVVGGYSGTEGSYNWAIARYNTDGSLDGSFNGSGEEINHFGTSQSYIEGLAIQGDGKIAAAGSTSSSFALARYNPDGSLDASFNGSGQVTTGFGSAFGTSAALGVAVQPDGKIVAAGEVNSHAKNNKDVAAVRYGSSESPSTLYVIGVYEDVLGRAPDPGGLAYWSHLLDTGTAVSAVAEAIAHSAEYYANFVIRPAYLKLLGRAADDAGVNFGVQRMQNGLTDQELDAGFVESDEFYAKAGGTDVAWIDSIYELLLGRTADPGGVEYWSGQLAAGISRSDIALQIADSAENESQLVNADYEHYLGRPADPSGVSYWLAQLAAGQTNEDIITGFTGSPEYYQEQTGVAESPYAGSYTGTYTGTYTDAEGNTQQFTDSVALVVGSNGEIFVTQPGGGTGRVEDTGAITALSVGSGSTQGFSYQFQGVFRINQLTGVTTAGGNWSATGNGYSGSGTWQVTRQ